MVFHLLETSFFSYLLPIEQGQQQQLDKARSKVSWSRLLIITIHFIPFRRISFQYSRNCNFLPKASTNVQVVVGNLATRKPRGPTLLKDVWKLPPAKTIDVPFNSRIVARTPELKPLNIYNWRNFYNEQKKKLVDFVRKFSFSKRGEAFILKSLGKKWKDYKRTQANRNKRANQKMPHKGGPKSIATLMHEQMVDHCMRILPRQS
ncbi:hypothetical protein H5410_027368 [Solanum commersonii]|uniref:Uncharacterized protein n=1 Tax=Solanum commersonii TaxID=4109 RepID=A0A9J5Z368_SOLCO|nr:hypothetical protein H5410_027368 [Solanum commersonii]